MSAQKPPQQATNGGVSARPPAFQEDVLDTRHPWRAIRTSLATLWRLSWQSDPALARRFVMLYGALLAVLLLLGEAFLVIALAVLRALWLAAPLYPGVSRALSHLGWPQAKPVAPPARGPWRTLHTALWVGLILLALAGAGWLLAARGFCAQNLICLTMRLWR